MFNKQHINSQLSAYCWKYLRTKTPNCNKAMISDDGLDPINYCAIELLERMGEFYPTAHQILCTESMIKQLRKRLMQNKRSERRYSKK